jgi:hypothetical protein
MQSATVTQKPTMRGTGRFVQMPTRGIIAAPARRPVAFSLIGAAEAMRRHHASCPPRLRDDA